MKITIPHFGNTHLAAKVLFEELHIDYVIPPLSSNKALEIGDIISPDEICLPFKIMLGNILQGIEEGADTVILPGSCGPCRFGEYCELKMQILKKHGYDIEFIVLEKPSEIGMQEFFNRIKHISLSSNKTKGMKLKALLNAYHILNEIDNIESKCRYLCGYEKNDEDFKRTLTGFQTEMMELKSSVDMMKCIKKYNRLISDMPLDPNKNPIKVSIIGEIYTVTEAFSNYFIENKLMDYGVSVRRTLSPSWWVKNMILTPIKLNSIKINRAAKEYIPLCIGGHATECIGEALLTLKDGFDGAIQVFPLGCMPEIVSKAVLKDISEDRSLPVLNLVVDGLSSETGVVTRLEAFIDMLERRKRCII